MTTYLNVKKRLTFLVHPILVRKRRCYRKKLVANQILSNEDKISSAENNNLLCKRKYYCITALQFDW